MKACFIILMSFAGGFAICYAFGLKVEERGADLGFALIMSTLCGGVGFFFSQIIKSIKI